MIPKESGGFSYATRLLGAVNAALVAATLLLGKHMIEIDLGADALIPYVVAPMTVLLLILLLFRVLNSPSRKKGGLLLDMGFVFLPIVLMIVLSVAWAGL